MLYQSARNGQQKSLITAKTLVCGGLLCAALWAATPAHAQLFGDDGAKLRPYLPTRAVVPTVEDLLPLAEQAYSMGMYYDSVRWFRRIAPFDADQSRLGIAKSYERMGEYKKALEALDGLHLTDGPYQEKAATLRASLLLSLAELKQAQHDATGSEEYLRTFINEFHDELSNRRYVHLMRQQAVLTGSLVPDSLKNNKENTPLRLALLLPLSGPMAQVGQSMQRAALLALFDQPLMNIELYPEDTQGTPAGAQAALDRAMQSGVDMVLGPLLSQNVQAIAPMANAADRPVLAYSSDRMAADGRNVKLFSIIPTEQAALVARYAVQHGLSTFSALMPEGAYGREMYRVFEAEITRLGGKIDRQSFYDPSNPDLTTAIKYLTRMSEATAKLKKERDALEKQYQLLAGAMDDQALEKLKQLRKADPQPIVEYEALFVPAPAETLALIASQLAFYDSDGSQVQLLGSSQWDSPKLYKTADSYLKGGIYPALAKGDESIFNAKYKATYQDNPHPLAALTYDSVQLISNFVENGLSRGYEFDRMVRSSGGFYGITGPYRFNEEGTLEHGYSLNKIRFRRGKMQPLELTKAPLILPAAQAPLSPRYKDESRIDTAPRRKSRGFFESIFGR